MRLRLHPVFLVGHAMDAPQTLEVKNTSEGHNTSLGESALTKAQPSELTNAQPPQLPGDLARVAFNRGHVVGSYVVEEEVGRGGMGIVYRARHVALNRIVALKIIPRSLANDPHVAARFSREMKAIGQLDHPGIVRALDAGEVDGVAFLAMDFVEGTTLSRMVKGDGPRSIPAACNYVRQAALALEYIHSKGLVHRDVKPSNLMITPDGTVKVADLGLARVLDDPTGTNELTVSQQFLGTPDYMSPEQWADVRSAGPAADLYSLGCTLFFALCGRPPFGLPEFGSLGKKLLAHTSRPAPDIRTARMETPAELAAVLKKLLAKNPLDRPQSAAEVAACLEPFCSEQPALTVSPATLWQGIPRKLVALAAVVALVAMAVVFTSRPPSNPVTHAAVPQPPATEESPSPSIAPAVVAGPTTPAADAAPAQASPRAPRAQVSVLWQGKAMKSGYAQISPTSSPLQDGDKVQVEVAVDPPGYLLLYWYDALGKPVRLWPVSPAEQSPVREFVSPIQGARGADREEKWFKIGGDRGLECVVAIAHAEPVPETLIKELDTLQLGIVPPGAMPEEASKARAWLHVDSAGIARIDRDAADRVRGLESVVVSRKGLDYTELLTTRFHHFQAWVIPHK